MSKSEFVINNTEKRAENVKLFEDALRLREHMSSSLLPYILKIKESRTIADIKQCYTYALYYAHMLEDYRMLSSYTSIIQEFITNPNSLMFEESNTQSAINTMIKSYNGTNRRYASFNIHSVISDPNFLEFDPLSYSTTIKSKHIQYGVIYAQALLYELILSKDTVIRDFVISAIDKITEIANNAMISEHYSYFIDTFELYRQSGGGDSTRRTSTSTKYIRSICEHIIAYLRSSTYEASELYVAPTRIRLCDYYICEHILDHVIVKYGIMFPTYIDYLLDGGRCRTEVQKELVSQFLKSSNKHTNRNTRRRHVKVMRRGTRRRRRLV